MMALAQENQAKTLNALLSGIDDVDVVADAVSDAVTDCVVSGISLDSRAVTRGDLFLACAGHQVHGVYFAEQAITHGAVAVLVEPTDAVATEIENLRRNAPVPVISIAGLGRLAGIIAERFFDYPSKALLTIGITGTNGKTSCSQFLAQALSAHQPCGIIGTIGNGLYGRLEHASHTTPDAVMLHGLFKRFLEQGAAAVVMEVSSHGLAQGRVAGVSFDVAVFTNLSRDHLDYHGDMDAYSAAKKRLFEMPGLKHAVLNANDDFGRRLLKELPATLNKVTYGIDDGADYGVDEITVRAVNLKFSPQGLSFEVCSPWGDAKVASPLLGRFNVSNLLAALATLLVLDIPLADALERIQRLDTVSGRMERVVQPRGGPVIVVDYAHTPDAVEKALSGLREHFVADQNTGAMGQRYRIFCVFGCGGDRDKGKRAHMGAIAEANADQVVITNDNPRTEDPDNIIGDIMQGISHGAQVKVIPDRRQAIGWAIEHAGEQDAVIILGKGHEQYQILGKEKHQYPGDHAVAAAIAAEKFADHQA